MDELPGTVITIRSAQELGLLNRLPAATTTVYIFNVGRCQLPLLPAHVTHLYLHRVNLVGRVALTEGLEALHLDQVSSEVSLLTWTFPSTLLSTTISTSDPVKVVDWDHPTDLRSVTSPRLHLAHVRRGLRFLLPEALDELEISDLLDLDLELPPHLRVLELTRLARLPKVTLEPFALQGVYPSVKQMAVTSCWLHIDISRLCPELEELALENYVPPTASVLELDQLQELTIRGPTSSEKLVASCPRLTKLTVGMRLEEEAYFDHPDSTLGETLTTLVVENVRVFPTIAGEWQRLESLTVINSPTVELPYIRWLEELTVDQPLMANGVMVETIDEYKTAWNVGKPPKRVPIQY